MIHQSAKRWDKKHAKSPNHNIIKDDKLIPLNRPCDRCGEIVGQGFIHSECAEIEMGVFLDILC